MESAPNTDADHSDRRKQLTQQPHFALNHPRAPKTPNSSPNHKEETQKQLLSTHAKTITPKANDPIAMVCRYYLSLHRLKAGGYTRPW